MLKASAWAAQQSLAASPWLILGKGPSFQKRAQFDLSRFRVAALNHVVREGRCDLSIMIDFDVFEACADAIDTNARFVALPWRPHFAYKPTERTLADLVAATPSLQALADAGRLIVFNGQTARKMPLYPDEPITPAAVSCGEAALNLLAMNGAREIRTLGVDGGVSYAQSFDDLAAVTRLANGHADFNQQFTRFAAALRRHPELLFGPLDIEVPARIFIGADETQTLGARVFEHSVRRFASISTTFEIIDNSGLPEPSDPQRRARTGFSFARFKIPELCGHTGRGLYVDADMQVFTDIKDLWTRDFQDAWLLYAEGPESGGRAPQYSVMLLDCGKLNWDARALVQALADGAYDYKSLMYDFAMMPADKRRPLLEFEWNSLESYAEGRTNLIHYTDMRMQPWVSDKNPHRKLWYEELRRAVEEGFISIEDIHENIARGHVSPNLPRWARLGPYPGAWRLARKWTPPYKRFGVKAV